MDIVRTPPPGRTPEAEHTRVWWTQYRARCLACSTLAGVKADGSGQSRYGGHFDLEQALWRLVTSTGESEFSRSSNEMRTFCTWGIAGVPLLCPSISKHFTPTPFDQDPWNLDLREGPPGLSSLPTSDMQQWSSDLVVSKCATDRCICLYQRSHTLGSLRRRAKSRGILSHSVRLTVRLIADWRGRVRLPNVRTATTLDISLNARHCEHEAVPPCQIAHRCAALARVCLSPAAGAMHPLLSQPSGGG